MTVFVASFLVAATVFHSTGLTSFQANNYPRGYLRMEGLRAVLFVLLPVVIGLLFVRSHHAILIGITGAYIMSTFFLGPKKNIKGCVYNASDTPKSVLRMFWAYGWPMSLWLGISMMFQVSDRFLLQHYMSFEETGLYAGLFDIVVRAYSLVFVPVLMAIHPRVMEAWDSGSQTDVTNLIRKGTYLLLLLSLAFLALLVLFGESILAYVLPANEMVDGIQLLLILAAAGFIWQLAILVHKKLEIRQKTRIMLALIGFAFLVALTFNILMIPKIGILAPAIGYGIGGVVYLIGIQIQIVARNYQLE